MFGIVSSVLTLIGLIAFMCSVRKSYKREYADAFNEFVRQLEIDHLHHKILEKYSRWQDADRFSITQYLRDNEQHHRNNSEHYAKVFINLQRHRIKTLILSIVGS